MIRHAAVAGGFYPADAESVNKLVDSYLEEAAHDLKGHPNLKGGIDLKGRANLKGVIAPHAGYVYSGPVAGYAYNELGNLPEKKYNVFMLGPSHFAYVAASVGNYEAFDTPLGKVKVNREICEELLQNPEIEFNENAHRPEHSLEVQLPFLQKVMSNYEIVPILLGEISPDYLSKILAPYFDREDSIFVVSSDLSHYRPYEEAQKIDAKTLKIITELDLENEMEIDACGSYGIKVIMRLAKQSACQIKLLNYRNSGDTAGDKSAVVGYASLAVIKP